MVKSRECDSSPQKLLRGRLGGLRGSKMAQEAFWTLYHDISKPEGEATLTGLGSLEPGAGGVMIRAGIGD